MKRALPFAGLALSGLLVMPAHAKEGDTFQPFVSYAHYYDSNLFRLAEGETTIVLENRVPMLVTRESASDQYDVLSVGLNVDWKPGRQQILASAAKNLVRFSRYTSLDYDGSDYQLRWNWRLGNHWSGQVGATESVTQSSFADFHTLLARNNLITRDDQFASAEWQFHPRWSVGLGAAAAKSTNSTLQQAPNDYDENYWSATLGYTTPKGSKLRGQLLHLDGEYPRRPPSLFTDRAYTQTEYNLLGDWSVSGKLVARGKIGYVQRENATLSQRNFSGPAGRLTADYYPTGKTMLTWAVYRELGNSDYINASYQVVTGTSVGAAWLATSKLTLRANASYDNRSFAGDTGFIGTPPPVDDTLGGSLSLSYAPVRMATIDLGLQAGRRNSDMTVNDYAFHSVFVRARADF